jgi:O-antigen/teichoic acid export membrane protein
MKATSIFGGVQVFNILITLIRGKTVAVLLGPAGMGLNGLFLSGLNLVKDISSLGIAESAVRDLALSHGKDEKGFNTTYNVFKGWIWLTALLGMVISILFAPLLSRFAFGDSSQTWAFMFLSATFVFGALTGGVYTVLRATRKISELAKANIYGSIAGLLVTLPILYFYGIDGVMPSIIAASLSTLLVSMLFRKYVKVQEVELTLKEKFHLGKPMVAMGINMSLSALLQTASAFALSAFITRKGGITDLGLYSAASSIMTGYVGMVFTTMSADYFPRLSQAIQNRETWQKVINHQAELLLLALTIVLSLMMGSVGFLIKLLLSKEFLVVTDFLLLLGLSIPIKGVVWTMGYLYLSKGDSKLFLKLEFFANLLSLSTSIIGYYYFGLTGIAMMNLVSFFLVFVFHLLLVRKKYKFTFSKEAYVIFLITFFLILTTYFLSISNNHILKWFIIILSLLISIYNIFCKLDLFSSIRAKFFK